MNNEDYSNMNNNEYNYISNNNLNNENNSQKPSNKHKKVKYFVIALILIAIMSGVFLYYQKSNNKPENKIDDSTSNNEVINNKTEENTDDPSSENESISNEPEKNIDDPVLKNEVATIINNKYGVSIDVSKLIIREYIPPHTEKRNQCTFSTCMSDVEIRRYVRLEYENKVFTLVGDEIDFYHQDVIDNTKDYYASLLGLNKDDLFITEPNDYKGSRCTNNYSYYAINKYNKNSADNRIDLDTLAFYIKVDKNNLEEETKRIIDKFKENKIWVYSSFIIDKDAKIEEKITNMYDNDRHDDYCIMINKKNILGEIASFSLNSNPNYKEYDYNGYKYRFF